MLYSPLYDCFSWKLHLHRNTGDYGDHSITLCNSRNLLILFNQYAHRKLWIGMPIFDQFMELSSYMFIYFFVLIKCLINFLQEVIFIYRKFATQTGSWQDASMDLFTTVSVCFSQPRVLTNFWLVWARCDVVLRLIRPGVHSRKYMAKQGWTEGSVFHVGHAPGG
jgi:hypothetical protein